MMNRRMLLRNSLLAGGTALVTWGIPGLGARAEELVSVHGAGSTFAAPLYKKWIDVYQQDHRRFR